jgi:hypothetical protein
METVQTGPDNGPLSRKFEVPQPRVAAEELLAAGFKECVCGKTGKACLKALSIKRSHGQNPATLECSKGGEGLSVFATEGCLSLKLAA